jgi:2-polyprenyl-6-methoxyphenol hydroxylase-like FAD-dependent oxidoreductase
MAEGTKQDGAALGSGFRAEEESEGGTERPTDVLVVGAGPVGLTLAIALARLSLRVRVVDKAPETKREPRAAVLWPRAMEILDDLGVAGGFEKAANELHSVDVYGDGHRLGELDVGHVRSSYPHPLVVEQHDTERLLAGRLARLGVRVEWRTEPTDVRLFDDRVEVVLKRSDGSVETAEVGWVVGCEGTRSVIREKLGIPFEGGRRKNLQVVQANAMPHWRYAGSSNNGYFFLVPRVALGVFPIPGGGYRFFAFTDDPDPSRKHPPTLGEMRDLVAKAAHAPELELELTEPVWITRARFQDRIAATLRRGRVLLAGDAAHAWAPVGGHGMNAGIRGAHNLAWKLAAVHRGEAHAGLLETYSQEQRATARAVIREMRFNVLEQPLPPIGLRAIRTLMPLALASRPLRRRVDFALSDLGMHHREGTLSWHREGRQRLRAGDRAPDVAIVADGRRTNLHRLLSLEHWTLFLPSGNKEGARRVREAVASVRASIHVVSVAPANPEVERALGGEGFMMLIRPDGHLGLLARSDDSQALGDYLRAFFVPSASEMGASIVGAKAGTKPPVSSP